MALGVAFVFLPKSTHMARILNKSVWSVWSVTVNRQKIWLSWLQIYFKKCAYVYIFAVIHRHTLCILQWSLCSSPSLTPDLCSRTVGFSKTLLTELPRPRSCRYSCPWSVSGWGTNLRQRHIYTWRWGRGGGGGGGCFKGSTGRRTNIRIQLNPRRTRRAVRERWISWDKERKWEIFLPDKSITELGTRQHSTSNRNISSLWSRNSHPQWRQASPKN